VSHPIPHYGLSRPVFSAARSVRRARVPGDAASPAHAETADARPFARTVRVGPFELHFLGADMPQTVAIFTLRVLIVLAFWSGLIVLASRLLWW